MKNIFRHLINMIHLKTINFSNLLVTNLLPRENTVLLFQWRNFSQKSIAAYVFVEIIDCFGRKMPPSDPKY